MFRREVEGVEMLLEMDVYRFEGRLLVKGTGETAKEAIEDAVISVADPKLKICIMNYYRMPEGANQPVKEALH